MACNSVIASPSPLPEAYYEGAYGYDAGCGCNQQLAAQPLYQPAQYALQQQAYVEPQQYSDVRPLYNDYVAPQQAPVYEELGTPAYALQAPLEQIYDEGLVANNLVDQRAYQTSPLVYQQPQLQQIQTPLVYQQQQQVQQIQAPLVYQQQQQQQAVVYQQQPQIQAPLVYQQQQIEAPAVYQQQQPALVYQQQPQNQLAYYQQQAPVQQLVGNDCACAAPVQSPVQYVQQVQAPTPTTFNKTVVTNLNRHHYHTLRVVDNQNNYNTYVTNHVTKVNDIHHYRVENVKGETRTFNDYKETHTVEPARCINGNCGKN